MNKLGATYLQAYLLTKSARYANYQTELLANTNFNQAKYLKTLAWELEPLEKQIKAKENLTKQASQTLDTFAHQAIQTMTEALAEKDQIIHELRQKLAEKESENQQLRLLLHTIVLTASQAVNREPEPEISKEYSPSKTNAKTVNEALWLLVKTKKGGTMNNQNQPKPRKIHELIGKVLSKDLKKVYDKTSPHFGSTFYRLNVALENNPLDKIYVFQNYVEKEQV
ncbi:9412_t:CDS:2 [Entrophospora sp. SA101]|nr:9412_t:CDS:2 [Entrophospora sp. SA101]